jgi:hypothetical protein
MTILKILISLLFYTPLGHTLEYPQLNCGTFEEYSANLKGSTKLYYRGDWNWDSSAVVNKLSEDELFESIKSFKYQDMFLGSFDLTFNHSLAEKEKFPVAYDKLTVEGRNSERSLVKRSYIPKVLIKTKYGYVTAIHKGEWGGELLLVKFDKEISFIKDISVEDMFPYQNGVVVVSGSDHMVSTGNVYFLEFEQNKFQLTKLFGLIDAPQSSWQLSNGNIIINSKSGTQLLSVDSVLRRVRCSKNES